MVRDETTVSTLIVADAGPLIHLDELGALRLLADHARVLVPEAVWLEVTRHRPGALAGILENLERTPPAPVSVELQALGKLYTLHRGEWEALALCSTLPDCRLLTDDTAARLAALALNIAANGTLGVLLRALRRGLCDKQEAIALLSAIPQRTSLHIRPSLLLEIIAEVQAI